MERAKNLVRVLAFNLVDLDNNYNRVYNEKLVNTSLSKLSLKKLILQTYQKTALSLNSKLYKQIDGVSMSRYIGSVLLNIIITECEKVIVDKLMKEKVAVLY